MDKPSASSGVRMHLVGFDVRSRGGIWRAYPPVVIRPVVMRPRLGILVIAVCGCPATPTPFAHKETKEPLRVTSESASEPETHHVQAGPFATRDSPHARSRGNEAPRRPPPGCVQSATLDIDLDGDSVLETVTADGCSLQVTIDGRQVPFSLRGRPEQESEGLEGSLPVSRFEIAPVMLVSGHRGVAVRFLQRGYICDEECSVGDVWITETGYGLSGDRVRREQPCNESATLRADFDHDGMVEEATIDGCTNRLQIGSASIVFEPEESFWPIFDTGRGVRAHRGRAQRVRGSYRFSRFEVLEDDDFDDFVLNLDFDGPIGAQRKVFRYDRGRLREISMELPSGQAVPISFDSGRFQVRYTRGAVRVSENRLASCRRASGSRPVRIRNTHDCGPRFFLGYPGLTAEVYKRVFDFDPRSLRFVERDRREETSYTVDCGSDALYECAACPFAYTLDEGGDFAYRGEILRELRSRWRARTQSLEIPFHLDPDGNVRVRLVEEKAETTYLDEVYVELNGAIVRAQGCAEDAPRSYCTADGVYEVLRQGDSLTVSFRPGMSASSSETVTLWASGYYVPD